MKGGTSAPKAPPPLDPPLSPMPLTLKCSLYIFCFTLLLARLSHLKSPVLVRLGNPKAAAHVAVRPSVLVTVKH